MTINKLNWNDITFGQYQEISAVDKAAEDLDKGLAYVSIIYDTDAGKMPMADFQRALANVTELTKQAMPTPKVKGTYGEYSVDLDLANISMAQYIDFQNFAKADDKTGILTVFIRPKGTEYMDGYDVAEVRRFVEALPIPDALALNGFFLDYCSNYQVIGQWFLRRRLRKTRRKLRMKRTFINMHSCFLRLRGRLASTGGRSSR